MYSIQPKPNVSNGGHHYQSGLSAISRFAAVSAPPDSSDLHLVRVAAAGLDDVISTVQASGASATAFHKNTHIQNFDAYSGDFDRSNLGLKV